ncbi:formate/nitrite transporter family protein [Diplocloster modestus]|uniref:Formate/nitrite transporter family protein n=1 Tax=Diplocloster modestus TaxID=2850322 RepID=A0ABS6KAS9_9FIRM|nr:formate/nitrite transporter family protein [Diplocloster modestus]MBU9727625.1 formate/nitrite transporter family protein [Diplocloster modestus]
MHTSVETLDLIIDSSKTKTSMPWRKLLALSILAGIFISVGAVASNTVSSTIENPALARLFSGLVFPAGLAMVVIAGSELFTGNNLMMIGVLQKQIPLGGMLRNWGIVYLGNLLGSLFTAFLVVVSGQLNLFGYQTAVATIRTAAAKCALGIPQAFALGILCNVLVCVAVLMTFRAVHVTGKLAALYLPILVFVLCGFEHSVANMYFIPAGLMAAADPGYAQAALASGVSFDSLTLMNGLKNLISVSLGNLAGGAGLVSCLYWYSYRR